MSETNDLEREGPGLAIQDQSGSRDHEPLSIVDVLNSNVNDEGVTEHIAASQAQLAAEDLDIDIDYHEHAQLQPGHGSGGHERKARFYFTPSDDILLLKECVAFPPWLQPHGAISEGWDKVARLSTLPITAIAAKNRWRLLSSSRCTDQWMSMRKSGTEEEYGEREILLDDLMVLEKDSKTTRESAKRKLLEDEEKGKQVRDDAMEYLRSNRNINDDDISQLEADDHEEVNLDKDVHSRRVRGRTSSSCNSISPSSSNTDHHDESPDTKRERMQLDRDRFEEDRKDREVERSERRALYDAILRR